VVTAVVVVVVVVTVVLVVVVVVVEPGGVWKSIPLNLLFVSVI
jgi:hypothetical protein